MIGRLAAVGVGVCCTVRPCTTCWILICDRGSVVGVYNGKQYITVEIKPVTVSNKQSQPDLNTSAHCNFCQCCDVSFQEMIGHYLGEFSITYKPIKHGRAGMMSKNSQFVPLK